MSLLNDALRKKEGEPKQLKNTNLVAKDTPFSTDKRKKIIGIIVIFFLAVGLTALYAWEEFFQPDIRYSRPRSEVTSSVPPTEPEASSEHPPQPENEVKEQIEKDVPPEHQRVAMVQRPVTEIAGAGPEPQETLDVDRKARPVVAKKPGLKKRNRYLKPKATSLPSNDINSIFYQKALAYHMQGRYEEAIPMYLQVLQKNPDHVGANFNLSSLYLDKSQYLKALPLLEKCRLHDPDNPQVLINMAIAAIGMGDPEMALTYLAMAENFRIAPKFEIYFHKGVAFSHLDNFENALRWYKEAEKIDPHNTKLIFNIGLAYDKLKQYPEALKYYSVCLNRAGALSKEEEHDVTKRVRVLRRYAASIN